MTKGKALQTLRGVRDILPEEQPYWMRVEDVLRSLADRGGFDRITIPTIEPAELFLRSVGEETDIIAKEMYVFDDRSGNKIALRPEGTAGVVRAYIEHGMKTWPKPIKFYYYGQFFRYDRPQAGRYRELWQLGFEFFGEEDAAADAQLIALGYKIFTELGLNGIVVRINTLGSAKVRSKMAARVKKFLATKISKLPEEYRKRAEKNPLRLLDSKDEVVQKAIAGLEDVLMDSITPEDREHFMQVLEILDTLSIPYVLDNKLVRGLDYYTRTVFEYTLEDSNFAFGGGGRYDELVADMGGDETPAVGLGLGVDRIVELMMEQKVRIPQSTALDVYVVQLGGKAKIKAIKIMDELETEGLRVAANLGRGSIKAQFRTADRLGAPIAVIIGEGEVHDKSVIVRDMEDGSQETCSDREYLKRVGKLLKSKRKD